MSNRAAGTLAKLGDSLVLGINKENAVGIQIPSTPTWAGTITAYGTVDGKNWFTIPLFAGLSTTTSSGYWLFNAVGLSGVMLTMTAYTSGTAQPAMAAIGDATGLPVGIQCTSILPTGATNGDTLLLSANARKIWGIDAYTIAAAPVYVKLYDKATAPTASDVPVHRTGVPANSTSTLGSGNNKGPWTEYVPVVNGLGFRIVTGIADSDNTVVTTAQNLVNVYWSE